MVIYAISAYFHEDDPYAGPHDVEHYAVLGDAEKRVTELEELHRTAVKRYAAYEEELMKLLAEAKLERYGFQTGGHHECHTRAKLAAGLEKDWSSVFHAARMGPFRPSVREVTVK